MHRGASAHNWAIIIYIYIFGDYVDTRLRPLDIFLSTWLEQCIFSIMLPYLVIGLIPCWINTL